MVHTDKDQTISPGGSQRVYAQLLDKLGQEDASVDEYNYILSKTTDNKDVLYSLERILFSSKDILPFNTVEDCGKWGDLGNLEFADQKLPESLFFISSLSVEEWRN